MRPDIGPKMDATWVGRSSSSAAMPHVIAEVSEKKSESEPRGEAIVLLVTDPTVHGGR